MCDPATGFPTLWTDREGLRVRRLAGVRAAGETLEIDYDVDPEQSVSRPLLRFPSSRLDVGTGALTHSGEEPLVLRENEGVETGPGPARRQSCPFLGGFVLKERKEGGKRLLCGTHGYLVLDGGVPAGQEIPTLDVAEEVSAEAGWKRPARKPPPICGGRCSPPGWSSGRGARFTGPKAGRASPA